MIKKTSMSIIFLFITKSIFSQNIMITAENGKFIIDENLQLIVCNNNISEFNDLESVNSLIINLDENSYEFSNIPNELGYGVQYTVNFNSQDYQLYFSELPIININTSEVIQDEPKVLASLLLTDTTDTEAIFSYCGIEIRGGFSQSYSKKSYDIELWEDETGDNNNKIPLLGMRDDDDWLLFAMYNEPLRIRNVINHNLWREIHTPYYAEEEDDAMSGIRIQYIELAINNEYMGLYALSEQIDKKQLQVKKYNSNIRGELYKGIGWGASTFTASPPFNNSLRIWSGFEMRYPKEEDITDWTNIYNFVDFVINSTDANFEDGISDKFKIDNAIDYYIFLNLLRVTDNTGKNIYIAKYTTDEPYFYVPWDLDGSLGIIWNGNQVNTTNDILTNGLYNRLLGANNIIFNEDVSSRWFELRNNILEESNLISNISEIYNFLLENANYEREILKWGQKSINLSNLEYTYEWLRNRLEFLDVYFNSTILDIEDNFNEIKHIEVYPNPVASTFKINTPNEGRYYYYIYNLNGIILKKGILYNKHSINIDYFSSGMYFLKITDNKNNSFDNIKLIKQ